MHFTIEAGDNVDVKTTTDNNGHTVYIIHALNAIVKPGPGGNVTVDSQPGSGNGTGGQAGGTGGTVTPPANDHTTTYVVDAKDTTYTISAEPGQGSTVNTYTVKDSDGNALDQKIVDTNTKYDITAKTGEGSTVNTYTVTDSDGNALKQTIVDTDTQYTLSREKGKTAEDGSTTYSVSLQDNKGGEAQTAEIVDTNTTNKEIAVTGKAEKTITLTDSDGNTTVASFKDLDTRNTVEAGANITVKPTTNADGSTTYTISSTSSPKVKVINGENTTVTEGKDGDFTTYAIEVMTDGKVASGDTGIVTGDTVYRETRVKEDGSYVKKDKTVAENITALDKQVKTNADNIENINNQFNNTYGEISRLDDRMKKGLAGAAALAALHPMDFDPDSKLTLAAGVGNYRSASAGAIGAFYRPADNVMFSLGGSFGNGENMVNAGVSFALDRVNRATPSRTAMAKEITALREQVAKQDEQIARQDEQIAKLTEMVNKLAGREQQVKNS